MANEYKLTSIDIKAGELEQAKADLTQVLTELWNSKVESHYLSLKYQGTEYWLNINTKNPQILFSANRTALLPFIRNVINQFFADKLSGNPDYFRDVDLEQRLNNTKYGTFIFDGEPKQRLAKAQIEKVESSPSRHGLFSRRTQPENEIKLDETKQGPQRK